MSRFSPCSRIFLSLVMAMVVLAAGLIAGCRDTVQQPADDGSTVSDSRPDPLKLLVIGEEKTGQIVARQWAARRDGELTVENQSVEEFIQSDFRLTDGVDVVIFPPALLGELAAQEQLFPVPSRVWNSEELNKDEILRHHRSTLIRHGGENWAVPLGAPQLAMMFRSDVLNREQNEALENWDSLADVVEQIGSEQFDLPLSEGWAAHMFLARVAPLIRDRGKLSTVFERRTMKPLIASPAFVLAMEDLKKLIGKGTHHFELEPVDVFRRIVTGKSQLGITWPAATAFENETPPEKTPETRFANLPGSDQWYDPQDENWVARRQDENGRAPYLGYGGLIGAVPRSSRNTAVAFEFLQWLASKPINLATMVESPQSGPFRASHLGDPTRWTGTDISDTAAGQYADVVAKVNDEDVVLIFPRIRGRDRYLTILDKAVRECLMNDREPATALENVAEKWNALTEELGRAQQIAELKKDSGL